MLIPIDSYRQTLLGALRAQCLQVLDDGYEKQDMVKWRDAEIVGNDPASMDDSELSLHSLQVEVQGIGLRSESRGDDTSGQRALMCLAELSVLAIPPYMCKVLVISDYLFTVIRTMVGPYIMGGNRTSTIVYHPPGGAR